MTMYEFRVSKKDTKEMTATQIKKELDILEKVSSELTTLMIELGRGLEKFSETYKKRGEDWLSTIYCDVADRLDTLRNEIEMRYGSRVHRLPKGERGFGPRKG